eukprot:Protomagalhaensia_sp_Gyna_25__1567@NODE_1806_length_1515_cov_21_330623_g1483_i0_p1_GENE_NODE_1806_length_1515_cov_21_330623_g1483_i0NODE_1806_length_1515_cov_21_330623_g1483_i0_p1_ORF_typecomplete_len389_score54_92ANAPC4_WD40/PF12894_7/1_6e03ANAPC4_WD40/PF12894_7/1_7ANAPC4_WD40/PF12894_7/0_15ANAPC4_WD40/PF12894_7/1_6e02PQQ_3/PF13570_6/0_28WD40_like/PF17005_5/0_84_NODE_1806_length_1515_cov_21_330623_g1483_i0921258
MSSEWNVVIGTLGGGVCGYKLRPQPLSTTGETIPIFFGSLQFAQTVHRKAVRGLAGSGATVVSGSVDETGAAYDLGSLRETGSIDFKGEPVSLQFVNVSTKSFLGAVFENGRIQLFKPGVWQVATESQVPQRFLTGRRIAEASWAPNAPNVVALRFSDGLCALFDIGQRNLVSTWKEKEFMTARGLLWSPSGSVMAIGHPAGVQLRHLESGKNTNLVFPLQRGTVSSIAICEDALFVGGNRGVVVAYVLSQGINYEPWTEILLPPLVSSDTGLRVAHVGVHWLRKEPVLMALQANGQLSLFSLFNKEINMLGVFDTRARPTAVYIDLPQVQDLGINVPSAGKVSGFSMFLLRRRHHRLKRRRLMGSNARGGLLESFKTVRVLSNDSRL